MDDPDRADVLEAALGELRSREGLTTEEALSLTSTILDLAARAAAGADDEGAEVYERVSAAFADSAEHTSGEAHTLLRDLAGFWYGVAQSKQRESNLTPPIEAAERSGSDTARSANFEQRTQAVEAPTWGQMREQWSGQFQFGTKRATSWKERAAPTWIDAPNAPNSMSHSPPKPTAGGQDPAEAPTVSQKKKTGEETQ